MARADIVPDLNGRVVRMIDKRTGHNLVRPFPPGDGAYPNAGGQVASAHSDSYARAWSVRWSVDAQSGDRVRLVGTVENGLQLSRTLELTGSGLHTVTVATNGSGEAVGSGGTGADGDSAGGHRWGVDGVYTDVRGEGGNEVRG